MNKSGLHTLTVTMMSAAMLPACIPNSRAGDSDDDIRPRDESVCIDSGSGGYGCEEVPATEPADDIDVWECDTDNADIYGSEYVDDAYQYYPDTIQDYYN